jgi:hypothetical protein
MIKLNFEELSELDSLVVAGYDDWVDNAPDRWKVDGFLKKNKPILVTSRYGQNARIAILGNESQEAESWQAERDFSKLSYFTFAIATSVKFASLSSSFPLSCSHPFPYINLKMYGSRQLDAHPRSHPTKRKSGRNIRQ